MVGPAIRKAENRGNQLVCGAQLDLDRRGRSGTDVEPRRLVAVVPGYADFEVDLFRGCNELVSYEVPAPPDCDDGDPVAVVHPVVGMIVFAVRRGAPGGARVALPARAVAEVESY